MRALFQEATFILVIGAILSISFAKAIDNDTVKSGDYQYEDYSDDFDRAETLFSEDKPCPRDCICTAFFATRLARCSRLEIGTQKFGDDVTDLVVEDVDSKHPIILSDMMFKKLGLQQVSNIKIANSVITSISRTAFKGLHELQTVNLTGNKIDKLDPETFAYNSKLSLLTLSDNPLTVAKNDWNQYILNSSSIQELDISKCNIKSLPRTAFSKMTSLMYINLAENKLHKIDVNVFSDLQDLEEVDLSHNFIKIVPDKLFANNSELATLRLGNNPISTVINVQIKELLTLDVSLAKIEAVGPSMFNGMQFISNLNLSGNGILTIHNQAFHKLVELNYLDLSNNKLNLISNQLIKENIELDVLKIANNPHLKTLPSDGFACSAEHFNIYLFDASGCSLETISDNFFKTMPSLSQLILSGNKLTSIGSALQATTGLVELDLSYNLISSLDKHTFSHNAELGKLNLAGNPLVSLSPELFLGTNLLTWMDISSCRLSKLWNEENENIPRDFLNKLHFMNISNNQIQSLHIKELDMINKLYTLDISQNPLRCDADFESLMVWLGKNKVSPASTDMHSAKLEKMTKKGDNRYKWEFLAKQICSEKSDAAEKNALNKLDDKWNFKQDYENYDTLDDSEVQVIQKDEIILKKISISEVGNHPEIYPSQERFKELLDRAQKENDIANQAAVLIKNTKVFDSTSLPDIKTDLKKIEEMEETARNFDEAMDEKQYVVYDSSVSRNAQFYNDTGHVIWRITRLVLLIVIFCLAIARIVQICRRRKAAELKVIAIGIVGKPNEGKVKKDCGLVYQQLTEDLSPRSSIVSKHEIDSTKPPQCV